MADRRIPLVMGPADGDFVPVGRGRPPASLTVAHCYRCAELFVHERYLYELARRKSDGEPVYLFNPMVTTANRVGRVRGV